MRICRLIAAILLALPLIVFGGNYFVQFFELPQDSATPGGRLLQAMREGGLMSAVAASHVVVGVLLLIPRTRFAAGLMQLTMSLGIVAFHATMLSDGLIVAGFMLLLNLLVVADGARLRALFEAPAQIRAAEVSPAAD